MQSGLIFIEKHTLILESENSINVRAYAVFGRLDCPVGQPYFNMATMEIKHNDAYLILVCIILISYNCSISRPYPIFR